MKKIEPAGDGVERQAPLLSAPEPLTLHSCVPYCEAAFLVGERNGWDQDRSTRFIDALDSAIINHVLPVRNADGATIHKPTREQHAEWHLKPLDMNAWLEKDGQPFRWDLAPRAEKQENPGTAAPAKTPEWKQLAVTRAREIAAEHRVKLDTYPSLIAIADQIAREWRTTGPFGPSGKPLAGATIKKHALNGSGIGGNAALSRSIQADRGK